jgi:hypothetical protein
VQRGGNRDILAFGTTAVCMMREVVVVYLDVCVCIRGET